MNDLVMRDGHRLFTTSEVIAEQSGVEHRATLQLIDTHLESLESFGPIAFEMRKGAALPQGGFAKSTRTAKLNEPQATLLLTFIRNTPKVVEFKKALVKAFFEMAAQLRSVPVPQTSEELMAAGLIEAHKVLAQRDQALAVAAPKAEAFDAFMGADGTYAMGDVAKMLGIGQNLLFQQLRLTKVLISDGARRNTPYQDYMKHFEVKAGTYEAPDGSRTPTKTTRVRPSGVEFIRKKLNLSGLATTQLSLNK